MTPPSIAMLHHRFVAGPMDCRRRIERCLLPTLRVAKDGAPRRWWAKRGASALTRIYCFTKGVLREPNHLSQGLPEKLTKTRSMAEEEGSARLPWNVRCEPSLIATRTSGDFICEEYSVVTAVPMSRCCHSEDSNGRVHGSDMRWDMLRERCRICHLCRARSAP
jgi:hypothetical protein